MERNEITIATFVFLMFSSCYAWEAVNPRSHQQKPGSFPSGAFGSVPSASGFWNSLQLPSQYPLPVSSGSSKSSQQQDPLGVQSQQALQPVVEPLTWTFPVAPVVQSNVAVNFQQKEPVTPNSVAILCGESSILIEVKQDLFGNGQLVDPSGLSLGGCSAVGEDYNAKILVFEYALQDCGSVLMTTADELVYMFMLTYTPQPFAGTSINRADGASVGIECHYQRNHNVSSNVLMPKWVPYSSSLVAQDVLLFSLRLMTDDWMYERPSDQYYLGQVINIQASVKVYNHVPLRVFVDECVATQVPDPTTSPRYSFIENYGCFSDGKTTQSVSQFLLQSHANVLQFQLEAFMFKGSSSSSVYITCALKATVATSSSDALHKSCSFVGNRWYAADGNDQVCGCCDSTCTATPVSSDTGVQWQGQATVGPFTVKGQPKLVS